MQHKTVQHHIKWQEVQQGDRAMVALTQTIGLSGEQLTGTVWCSDRSCHSWSYSSKLGGEKSHKSTRMWTWFWLKYNLLCSFPQFVSSWQTYCFGSLFSLLYKSCFGSTGCVVGVHYYLYYSYLQLASAAIRWPKNTCYLCLNWLLMFRHLN